jgi:hypothetical protein
MAISKKKGISTYPVKGLEAMSSFAIGEMISLTCIPDLCPVLGAGSKPCCKLVEIENSAGHWFP